MFYFLCEILLYKEFLFFVVQKLEEEKEVPIDDLNNPPADVPGEIIVSMVTTAVNSIMQRLNSLTNFEGIDSKVSIGVHIRGIFDLKVLKNKTNMSKFSGFYFSECCQKCGQLMPNGSSMASMVVILFINVIKFIC